MPWKEKPRGGRILIVEDERDILQVLQLMLEDEGHTVVTAKRGREALAAANSRPFDVILMDISMPEMNGFEIAQALRANEKTKDIRIAIHTGHAERWVKDRFPDYDLFLSKADDIDLLVEKISALASHARNPASEDTNSKASARFSIEEAMKARQALRDAAGLGNQLLDADEFARSVSAENDQLRRLGRSEQEIADLIAHAIGRPFSFGGA